MSYSTYADQLDTEGKAWIPAKSAENDHPHKLIGVLVDLDERTTQYGTYPILTIQDEQGDTWSWHAFGTVAIKECEKVDPQIGDVVGVKYRGLGEASEPGRSRPVLWTVKCFERNGQARPVGPAVADTVPAATASGDASLPSPPPAGDEFAGDIDPGF